MPITISGTADALNQFHTTFAANIKKAWMEGLELENRITPTPCEHTYAAPNVTLSDIVQPWQVAFTPNNSETFDSVENVLKPIKIDIQYTILEIEKFFDKWKVEWVELGGGKSPLEWTFPRYMWEKCILPKVVHEMNSNAWHGVYAAPTPGTPGASVDSVDGFGKVIADAITATDITPITTGPPVSTTMVAQVETFCDGIPQPYRDAPGSIYMSKTNARLYARDYRNKYGYGVGVSGNTNEALMVDATNKRIIGLANMEGSDRWWFSPEAGTNNIIFGVKKGLPSLPIIRWEQFERTIKGMAEFYRFYGFDYWDLVFVNDQA